MLANTIDNEFLYSKHFPVSIRMPSSSLFDILHSNNISYYSDLDGIYSFSKVILDNFSISSPLVSNYSLSQNHVNFNLKETSRYSVFKDLNYPYLFKKRFRYTSKDEAFIFYKSLLMYGEVTFTITNSLALDAIHGLSTETDFDSAWETLAKRKRAITIENSHKGDFFKIFIKDDQILGIYALVPAFIVGDGKSTIDQLIKKLEIDRNQNILYKNYKLRRIKKNIERSYIPIYGEVIKLKDSLQVEYGAVYIDLTDQLKGKFQELASDLKRILLDIPYLEIGCFSNNLEAGLLDSSFKVSYLSQNRADVRHLLTCASTEERLQNIITTLFGSGNKVNSLGKLNQAELCDNNLFKSTDMTYLLKEAAYQLGLIVTHLEKRVIKIENPIDNKSILFRMGMSQYTTTVARRITKDKYLTKKILEKHNINTPMGFMYDIGDMDKAWNEVSEYCIENNKRLVIKPLDRNAGTGVSTDITTEQEFRMAWELCENVGSKKIIVEEQFKGDDYRVFVVQDEVCAATQRIAAFVVGDGIHTVKELINLKNKKRKENIFLADLPIKVTDHTINFLFKRGIEISYTPEIDERIQLSEVANASIGGDTCDRTEDIHPDWIPIAVRAREIMVGAYHVGLDIMMEDISKSPEEQEWAIIEINTNPDFGMQIFPGNGDPRNTAKSLLKRLFPEVSLNNVGYKLTVFGKVQGVGFRNWLKSICDYRSITGYVQNADRGNQVEVVLIGSDAILQEVIKLAYKGPRLAQVDSILSNSVNASDFNYNGFLIK